jgi:hypothetical protein
MPTHTDLKAGVVATMRRNDNAAARYACRQDLALCQMMAAHGHIPADYLATCEVCLERFPDLG